MSFSCIVKALVNLYFWFNPKDNIRVWFSYECQQRSHYPNGRSSEVESSDNEDDEPPDLEDDEGRKLRVINQIGGTGNGPTDERIPIMQANLNKALLRIGNNVHAKISKCSSHDHESTTYWCAKMFIYCDETYYNKLIEILD